VYSFLAHTRKSPSIQANDVIDMSEVPRSLLYSYRFPSYVATSGSGRVTVAWPLEIQFGVNGFQE
jgi:hypothetical protein